MCCTWKNSFMYTAIVGLMSSQWKKDKSVHTWILPNTCTFFSEKFDQTQEQLQKISCADELLSGELLN